ncbi:hypothetical protein Hanom_Chr06g00512401 [Helianthus anomalus]
MSVVLDWVCLIFLADKMRARVSLMGKKIRFCLCICVRQRKDEKWEGKTKVSG